MTWLRRFARRLRLLVRHAAVERVMDDELRYHVERETQERIRAGMSPEAAQASALRDFGGIERFKEEVRDARGVRPVEDLIADTRYAARVFARNPGFTATAILTFALGIGAASAIFAVVYGVLLRPLPYADPDRLVVLWENDGNVVSLDNLDAWRDCARSFEGMAALIPQSATIALAGDGAPDRIPGARVSPGYFRLLGVAPALGREFVAEEGEVGGPAAVMLSDAVWRQRFAADPAIVGRTLIASGEPYTIVGVMPPRFEPPKFGWLGEQELWFPFVPTAQTRSWGRALLVVARLKPGVAFEAARAEMAAIADRLSREVEADRGWTATAVPLARQLTGDVRTSLLILLAAVGLLLLIAITNVATLTLSMMRRRTRELAIRRALGATDQRLFRQVLTQGLLLGVLGAAAGLVVAQPATRLLVALLPPDAPRLSAIQVDGRVLAITSAIAMLAAIVSALVSAARGRPNAGIGVGVDGARHLPHVPHLPLFSPDAGDGRVAARAGGLALVTAEIAIAFALAVMAMLMARSFAGLRAVDLGFTADRVLAARVSVTSDRYPSKDSQRLFFDTLLTRVRALPGVDSAGLISLRPFGGSATNTNVRNAQPNNANESKLVAADIRWVDAELFRTLRMPLRGTGFDSHAPASGRPRVVISESLARQAFPGGNPLGRGLFINLDNEFVAEVVGVVGDAHLFDARAAARPAAYLWNEQFPDVQRDLIVRVNGDPQAIVPALRALVASMDPAVPMYKIAALPGAIDEALATDRFSAFLLSMFATLALLLGGVGVFGVFAGEVAGRRKEIAIRLALGAHASTILAMVLRQSLARISMGIAGGTLLALGLARAMESMLFGVASTDAASFLTSTAVVCGLALLATVIPTLQVLRSSPLGPLHND